MKNWILLIVGVFVSVMAFSQGSVSGLVIEESTGESLPFANVRIKETEQISQTDVAGKFKISEVTAGDYMLVISYVGMEDLEQSFTLADGQNLDLGEIKTGGNVIGLDEVEVFAVFIDENKQVATPVTTINSEVIEQKMGAQEFTELMKSAPGVFVTTLGGSFGSSQVKIRGFGSENTAVLINGVPVNDMENGRVFWSNWGGLNDVTKNQQIQRGLGASKLAISSVGGTINIITKPTEFRKGIKLSYAYANRSYQHRAMVTSSTGMMKDSKMAITASASTRQGQGFRDGTQAESYSYFLTIYKELNDKHQIMFTGFGAPQSTWGGRSVTQTSYEVVGEAPKETNFFGLNHKRTLIDGEKRNIEYNPAWGKLGDEKMSAAQNKYHKPMFMLNHYWDINDKLTLATSTYYSFGAGGGTTIDRNADAGPNPIPFQLQPNAPKDLYQISWDTIYKENQADTVTLFGIDGELENSVTGMQSKYILVRSRNDHKWLGGISTLNGKIDENTSFTVGLDYRWYRGLHYRVLEDLLGGDFWLDQERFNNEPDNNLLQRRHAAVEGETIGYNYSSTIAYGGLFAQMQKTIGKFDLFGTGALSYTTFFRNGKFLHEEFQSTDPSESSLGFSNTQNFQNYTIKGGANYKINGRHNVFFNAGRFTRAPFFRNSFIDNRVSNKYRDGVESSNEKFFSLEAGYGYRAPKFAGHANLYRTRWDDRGYIVSLPSAAFNGDFVTFNMNDVDAVHQGIEFDGAYALTKDLKLKGMLSLGDWRYKGNAEAVVLTDPGLTIADNPTSGEPSDKDPVTIYLDDLRVGGSAQTTASIGLNYRGRQKYYCGFDYNFYGRMYADFNPETKIYNEAYFNQVQRMPDAGTIDLYGGKSFKYKGLYIKLGANINNLFNNQFLIDVNERTYSGASASLNGKVAAPSPFVQYYYGRTYSLRLSVSF